MLVSEVGIVSTAVTGLALIGIGTVIGVSQFNARRESVSGAYYFIALCYSLALWLYSNVLSDIDTTHALLWVKLSFAASAVGIGCLLLFVNRFPRPKYTSLAETSFHLAALAVLLVLIAGSTIIPEVVFEGGIATVVPGPLYLVFVGYILLTLGLALTRLIRRRSQDAREHRQKQLILIGVLITAAVAVTTNLILPLIVGSNDLYWLASISTLAFVGATAYAIAKQGLFDIRAAVIRTLAYAASILTVAMIYYGVLYLASSVLLRDMGDVATSVLGAVSALVLAFTFQPIKQFFDRNTNRLFFRDRYDPELFYARISEILSSTSTLHDLLHAASREVAQAMKARYAFFFIDYGQQHRLTIGTASHRKLPSADAEQLRSYVQGHGQDVIITESFVADSELYRMLASHHIGVVLPLAKDDMVFGFLILGEHLQSRYSEQDMRVLRTVRDELIIGIQNALSVQEVRDINESLEQRIQAATAELRSTNARLTRLDAAKDEFLSMASHQLRTPLTSIKGYLSMVLEGDVGKVSDMQRKVLEEAYSSSERMVHLIHDFLNVSRLQTGKFMLEVENRDIVKLVRQEVKSLETSAASHDITLDLVTKLDSLTMNFDDTKIRQVVMNYIDNAIFYSDPGTTITIELSKTKGNIQFTVKDTGIGVPKSEQAQLFEKFYRASNARKQRPDGTGVGLYLAKVVITAHGGKIIFSSREGKGSTFGFSLPIDNPKLEDDTKQLEEQPDNDKDDTTSQ